MNKTLRETLVGPVAGVFLPVSERAVKRIIDRTV